MLVLSDPKRISRRGRSFEILLVADSELVAQALSATLRRAGHRVTASTTIVGTVETLMRRGPYVDVIMTSMRFDTALGDDVVQYSRKFAANARFDRRTGDGCAKRLIKDRARKQEPSIGRHRRENVPEG